MPIQLRFAIICSAAIIAAAANHRYLASRLATSKFVVTKRDVPIGGRLAASDLSPVSFAGDLRALEDMLVPWDERMLVVETPVLREYRGGQLIARRDVEQNTLGPYVGNPGEYVFTVELPQLVGLKSNFNIGSQVGFLISQPESDRVKDGNVVECGPFVLRQIGPLSKRVDARLLQKAPTRTVTLSLAADPRGGTPPNAQELLAAVSGIDGRRIVGLYDPKLSE